MTRLTRRHALALIAAAPALARPASATAVRASYAERLAALLPGLSPHELRLLRFDETPTARGLRLAAVVELRWPPGLRRRPVAVEAEDGEAAFAALVEGLETRFGGLSAA